MTGNTDKNFNHVFVYGSLKKGLGNHSLMKMIGAESVGNDTISGALTMISYGRFPAVCHNKAVKGVNEIFGQVYKVREEGLRALDGLEGHPRWYRREKMITDYLDKRVWIYLMPQSSLIDDVVDNNMWRPSLDERKFWSTDPFAFEFAA